MTRKVSHIKRAQGLNRQSESQPDLFDPETELRADQMIAKVTALRGQNLIECATSDGKVCLAEIIPRLRNLVWIRLGRTLIHYKEVD